jgi:alkyl sulfatase BDS1-like metallo-beta-lactamase superfamily hydrolase
MVTNRVLPGFNRRARADVGKLCAKDVFDRWAVKQRVLNIQGNVARLQELLGMRDNFNPTFDIVTPNATPRRP